MYVSLCRALQRKLLCRTLIWCDHYPKSSPCRRLWHAVRLGAPHLQLGGFMSTTLARVGLGFALLLSAPVIMLGQAVYGSIVGTVRDSSGAPIPNAKVTVIDVRNGISHVTNTNDTGNYSQTHRIVAAYQ